MDKPPPPDPVCILGVTINCCDKCPRNLKNRLYTLHGVTSVKVYPERRVVEVRGKIDHLELIEKIAEWGKRAELLLYDKYPIHRKKKRIAHEKGKNSEKDILCTDDSDHYKENYKFEEHEPVKFADVQTEFLDHICGNVRFGNQRRHPVLRSDCPSMMSQGCPYSNGTYFSPHYPIRPPHYGAWY